MEGETGPSRGLVSARGGGGGGGGGGWLVVGVTQDDAGVVCVQTGDENLPCRTTKEGAKIGADSHGWALGVGKWYVENPNN